jgi:hypothetical protein
MVSSCREQGFRVQDLLTRYEGNEQIVRMLARFFATDSKLLLFQMQQSIESNSGQELVAQCQELWTMASNLEASTLCDQIRSLQRTAQSGEMAAAASGLQAIQIAVDQVCDEFSENGYSE